jgi:hypothetical protein
VRRQVWRRATCDALSLQQPEMLQVSRDAQAVAQGAWGRPLHLSGRGVPAKVKDLQRGIQHVQLLSMRSYSLSDVRARADAPSGTREQD